MIIQIIKLCKVNFGKTSLMAASIFLTLKIGSSNYEPKAI